MDFLENIQKLLNRKRMFDTSTEEGGKDLISGLHGLNMKEEETFSMTY